MTRFTRMKLEVISKTPSEPNGFPPMLLVHGAWHGAWCWQGTFLDYFQKEGWEVHAISLRGHGQSEGREKLRRWSIADYVSDVDQVVKSLRRPPIIVGHSMGGLVTQKYLETRSITGAVLLASVPPAGTFRFALRLFRRHPAIWLQSFINTYAFVRDPEHAREWFFSQDISDEQLTRHHLQLQAESLRVGLDALILNLPRPNRVTDTPIAVLGAEHDAIFSIEEIKETARAYDTQAKIFPGMAHNMMCEPGWQDVAAHISDWGASISKPEAAELH